MSAGAIDVNTIKILPLQSENEIKNVFLIIVLSNCETSVAIQMLGVFFIKASAYKIVQENSKHGKDSYFYSIEHKSQKSMGHASLLTNEKPHDDFDPGKSSCNALFTII